MRAATAIAIIGLAACGFDAPGAGAASAGFADAGQDTDPPPATTGGPGTASNSGGQTTAPMSTSTAGDGTAGDGDTGPGGTTMAGETGALPQQATLQNAPYGDCSGRFWCVNTQNGQPIGGPLRNHECFSSPIAPPFDLDEVHYFIDEVHPALTSVLLEVRQRTPTGPGTLITSQPLGVPTDTAVGEHTLTISPPIEITYPEFCVGLFATDGGVQSAIALATDLTSAAGGTSYLQSLSGGGCDVPDFRDLVTLGDDARNWCLDVSISN